MIIRVRGFLWYMVWANLALLAAVLVGISWLFAPWLVIAGTSGALTWFLFVVVRWRRAQGEERIANGRRVRAIAVRFGVAAALLLAGFGLLQYGLTASGAPAP